MSNKKKKLLAQQITEILQPRDLLDPEKDDDITAAATTFGSWSDEEDPEVMKPSMNFSKFRRTNYKEFTKNDPRYAGEVVSRAELEKSDQSSDESEEEEDSDLNDEKLSSEGSMDEDDDEPDDIQDEEEDDENLDETDDEEEEDNFQVIRPENHEDNIKKGNSIKSQLEIWEKLLEIRIKSQKLVQCANTLPYDETHKAFSNKAEYSAATAEVSTTLINLIQKMQTLKSSLFENYPETRGIKRKISELSVDSIQQDLCEDNFREYRNTVLRKWHDRVKVATSSKAKQMETHDIIQKIENSMINKADLLDKLHTYRGGYKIVGAPHVEEGTVVPEIYDDSEFYHNLLRELIEYKTNTSDTPEIDQKYLELQSLRSKIKKKVDTRASKGRKIRYIVHNKLVNFMQPVEEVHSIWTEEAKTDLFNSLFDKANG